MPRFSKDHFPPGFFDLSSQFARDLPFDLIARWTATDQTPEAARALLEPHIVTGTLAVSDSAGLTSLSMSHDLLDVMALINRPKELVHQFGTAIGGQAAGLWTADNTEMYYPAHVGCDDVASMLLALQDRIRRECQVQIGIGVHVGQFFLLGNSVYGTEAGLIEDLAEERTEGGEIVLTEAAWRSVCGNRGSAAPFRAIPREQIQGARGEGYRLLDGPRLSSLSGGSLRYPFPFSSEFYEYLTNYRPGEADVEAVRRTIHSRFGRQCAVLLIERETDSVDDPEVALLDNLSVAMATRSIGTDLLALTAGTEVKTAGSLSIYVFADAPAAHSFAIRYRDRLKGLGIATRSGISQGEVLLFELEGGGMEICGAPVNLASKVAQDHGDFGNVYWIEQTDTSSAACAGDRVTFTIAGVEIPARVS